MDPRPKLQRTLNWIVPQQGNGLLRWRARILSAMLLGLCVFSLVALVPSVYYAARHGQWGVVAIDFAAYTFVVGLTVGRGLSSRMRALLVLGLTYVLGTFFLLRYGVVSAGTVWLFAFGVLSAVLLGFRAAYVALSLNIAAYTFVGVLIASGNVPWGDTSVIALDRWIVISVNCVLLNTLAATSVAALLRGLDGEVAARRRAEQEHVMLVGAVEQATEAIAVTDLQGRVTYANAAFARLSGVSDETLKGRVLTDIMPPTGDAHVIDIHVSGAHDAADYAAHTAPAAPWTALAAGNVWAGQLTANGEQPRVAESTITPFRDESGQLTNGLAVLRDVTRERELESHLRQAQKLEAIGTLAGGIAHDFNNLLLPILLNVEELQRTAPGEQPDPRLLRDVRVAAERARDLVRRILTFSRNEKPERRPVDLPEVVREIVSLLRSTLPASIVVETKVDVVREVNADSGELHQVLMNLATNALHAMPEGGTLAISVTNGSDPSRLELRVRDSGVGMNAETQRRAFEPFFTTKGQGRGTGLGLATVHGIVTSLDGDIAVESTPGEGTTVTITLPTLAATVVGTITAARPDEALPAYRILLIDDEPAILTATRRLLQRLGMQVECESDARIAWQRLHAECRFDCVLTDLTMPGMSGLQLAQALHDEGHGIPVVLMTGYLELASADALGKAGIGHVVTKPFSLAQLSHALRVAIESGARTVSAA